jgi:ATPases involved in chromosome partitioning
MGPSEKEVLDALRKVRDPELGADVVSMGMIKDLRVEGGRVYFTLELTTPACPFNEQLKEEVLRAARSVRGVTDVTMEVRSRVPTTRPQSPNMVPIPGVKNVVAVASGKGGVGKSTIAVNLAAALSLMGAKTGLLDADVYGPTIPRFIRDYRVPLMRGKDKKVEPAVGPNGLKLISLGMMVEDDTPIIWRGPLVGSAVRQLLFDVDWGELDYLIVDLPPGTGDAPLTLAQSVPMSGVVIVTTPQQAAVAIAMKALRMFQKLGVPIIGIVENMSYLKCEHCNNVIRIFGESWARRAALEAGVPLLGEVPMDREILEGSESGVPIVLSNPDSDASKALIDVARRVARRVSVLAVGR